MLRKFERVKAHAPDTENVGKRVNPIQVQMLQGKPMKKKVSKRNM